MKLSQVQIKNFRLLQAASMRLNTKHMATILVGPNNSGKTSAAEALLIFLDKTSKAFSLSDFSLNCRSQFDAFQAHLLAPAPVAGADGVIPEQPVRPPLPYMSLVLQFDYTEDGADLAVAGELLMDLDVDQSTVAIEIRFVASDASKLASDYIAQRDEGQSLTDYLAGSLNGYYKLEYFKVSPDGAERTKLPDRGVLDRLMRVDLVSAQRHIDDREHNSKATRLSELLHTHYERRYRTDAPADYKILEKALKDQSTALGDQYVKAFGGLMNGLSKFGHPESPKLTVRAELSAATLFKDSTRVYYSANVKAEGAVPEATYDLPERYNGLGFKNLIYIVLRLKSFREDLEASTEQRPRVHLIIVEEPEVHLHPQMQSVFVKKVSEFLASVPGQIDVQLLLTTHSSHIVANGGFEPIRYFKRKNSIVEIKDLLAFEKSATTKAQREAVEFLEKYLTTTRCDMFFADKLVFIEGQVERMLLPKLVQTLPTQAKEKLASSYITVVEVGGAYAHVFKSFIEFLELPTLIVTDLDAIDKTTKERARVAQGNTTSNATLKKWLPGMDVLADLCAATDAHKQANTVRVTYQVPDDAHLPCGRSFEEAFVYANLAWLIANKTKLIGTGDKLDYPDAAGLSAAAYDLSLHKVDFALDLMSTEGWTAPKYIKEGLEWLSIQ
jgi:putative ATP-dependent endonuclease of OLD family